MSEYFNLINRMREGVLVLIRDPQKCITTEIKFSNKSSEKIFGTSDREDTSILVSDLSQCRFQSSKLLKENLQQHPEEEKIPNPPSSFEKRSENSSKLVPDSVSRQVSKNLVSLEEIIEKAENQVENLLETASGRDLVVFKVIDPFKD